MNKFLWVFIFALGCLFIIVGINMESNKPVDLYIGLLIKVEYFPVGGWGSFESWVLTFEDGQIWTIREQPKNGFRIGEIHIIYENKHGYLRAKRG